MVNINEYNDSVYERLQAFTTGVASLIGIPVKLEKFKGRTLKLDWDFGVIYISTSLLKRVEKNGTKAIELMITHELIHMMYDDDSVYDSIRNIDLKDKNIASIGSILLDVRADVRAAELVNKIYCTDKIDMESLMEFRRINDRKISEEDMFKQGLMLPRNRIKIMHDYILSKKLLNSICNMYKSKGVQLNDINTYKIISYILGNTDKAVEKSRGTGEVRHYRNKHVQ